MVANVILTGTRFASFLLQAVQQGPGAMPVEPIRQAAALQAFRHDPSTSPGGILVPIALFAMIAVVVWLGLRQKQARLKVRAEFHKQLLDKFGSGKELAEFLESPASKRFLDELWSQSAVSDDRPLRLGVVLTTLGLALGALSWTHRPLLVPGVVVLALGVGYLISSAISYRLGKKRNGTKEPGAGNYSTS